MGNEIIPLKDLIFGQIMKKLYFKMSIFDELDDLNLKSTLKDAISWK